MNDYTINTSKIQEVLEHFNIPYTETQHGLTAQMGGTLYCFGFCIETRGYTLRILTPEEVGIAENKRKVETYTFHFPYEYCITDLIFLLYSINFTAGLEKADSNTSMLDTVLKVHCIQPRVRKSTNKNIKVIELRYDNLYYSIIITKIAQNRTKYGLSSYTGTIEFTTEKQLCDYLMNLFKSQYCKVATYSRVSVSEYGVDIDKISKHRIVPGIANTKEGMTVIDQWCKTHNISGKYIGPDIHGGKIGRYKNNTNDGEEYQINLNKEVLGLMVRPKHYVLFKKNGYDELLTRESTQAKICEYLENYLKHK